MKKVYISLIVIISLATTLKAQLSLPIYEPFGVDLGSLGGKNTWTGNANPDQGAQVVDSTLTYPGLFTIPGTNAVRVGAQPSGSAQQLVFTTQNTITYASFLIRLSEMPPTLGAQTYYFAFGVGGTPGGNMYAIPNPDETTFELGFNTLAGVPAVSNRTTKNFKVGDVIMVVMAYTPAAGGEGALSAWVNPTEADLAEGAPVPTATFAGITGGNLATITNVFIRSGANTRKMIFDELRVGKTWSEVTNTRTVLPVTIADLKLTTKNEISTITWSSKTEVNFKDYVVMFSKEGRNFNEVGTVPARGNNSQYSFNYSHTGEGFFKLKLVDRNGSFAFSKVLHANAKTLSIKIGPNPAVDRINISGMLEGANTIMLYNMNGVAVRSQLAKDANMAFSLAGLPAGNYVLRITNEGKSVYSTIITK